jgi:hypothetical protein
MKLTPKTTIFCLLLFFVLGWCTQQFALFDVGRFSFPLILFVGLPFCLRITYRSFGAFALPIASTIFAILIGWVQGIALSRMLSQAILAALAIAFGAGIAAINWHKHRDSLEKALVVIGIPVVVYGCYQMAARVAHLPGAFLPVTNKQYYADGAMQLGWNKPEFTRASSVFSEPSEFAYFCLWLFVIGLASENKKLRMIALLLSGAGLLASQSLSGILTAAVVALAFCVMQGISRQLLRNVFLLMIVFGVLALALKALAPAAYSSFSERILQAVSFDERADSGRVDHLPACFALIKASPVWGYGMSSLAGAPDSSGADVTTVNYVLITMERGAVGALLFFIPWFSFAIRAWFMPRRAGGRTFVFLLMVMTLCSFFSFSIAYFLPFWLAYGMSASLVLQTHAVAARKNSSLAQPYRESFANRFGSAT